MSKESRTWIEGQLTADFRRATRRLCNGNAAFMAGYVSGLRSAMILHGVDFKSVAQLSAKFDAKFIAIMDKRAQAARISLACERGEIIDEDELKEALNNLKTKGGEK